MYQPHPSAKLQALFRRRPFQGGQPENAEFLFVGLDANYAADLERAPAFGSIVEYHDDGVAFWLRHRVNHPFLLPSYRGDGRRYHQKFARVGFKPEDAARVSFIELLHLPTVGRSNLEVKDLDPDHLDALNALVMSGRRRHIFLSRSVVELMRQSARFRWVGRQRASAQALPVLHHVGATTVYQHLHFSSWTDPERVRMEAAAIAVLATGDTIGLAEKSSLSARSDRTVAFDGQALEPIRRLHGP